MAYLEHDSGVLILFKKHKRRKQQNSYESSKVSTHEGTTGWHMTVDIHSSQK